MRRVQERVAYDLMARLLERELPAREETPGRLEVGVGGLLKGLARLRNGPVERRHELRGRVQWSWFVLGPSFGAISNSFCVMARPTHDTMFATRSDR